MSFLDSEYVRAGLVEINEIQEDIYSDMMKFPQMTTEEKYEHVSKLEDLLEKQKIMYTQVSLSDDPESPPNQRKYRHRAQNARCPR